MSKPNILYIHSHDSGRYIQPYGYGIPTPHLQKMAERGLLFRQACCAAPTCSPSRAALLTGQAAHSSGMMGLVNRGFALKDYKQHIIHTLKSVGYTSALAGIQHIVGALTHRRGAAEIGYDHLLGSDEPHQRAIDFIASAPPQPFFLTVGFFETHREFPREHEVNPNFTAPPRPLPDTPAIRQDMANYIAMAKTLDDKIGQVLQALDDRGLREDTLIIYTTDHGIAFPGMKCSLKDAGIGVALIMQGPAPFNGGQAVDALVSHIDIFPTLCDLLNIPPPAWLQGHSILPLLRGEAASIRDAVFAEVNYHAAYEPKRAVRTDRHKYIRRYDRRQSPVLANIDDGFSKDDVLKHGFADRAPAAEELYDTFFDPTESHNLAGHPAHADLLRTMRSRLDDWMRATDDPLLQGPVAAPPTALLNDPDDPSPRSPARRMIM